MVQRIFTIVHVIDTLSETSIPVRLAYGINAKGIETYIFCMKWKKNHIKYKSLEDLKIYYMSDFFNFIIDVINKKQVILHTHHIRGTIFGLLLKTLRLAKMKYCFTLHSHFSRYSRIQKVIFKLALKRFDASVFNSKSTCHSVGDSVRCKSFTIYNGVKFYKFDETAFLSRMEKFKKLEELSIAIVGRLEPIKNFDISLKIVARLKDAGIKVNLDVLGDGSEYKRLKDLANELNISDICDFKGLIPHDELISMYPDYDVLLILSKQEGFCNVAVEAASQACLLVLSDIEVFREIYDSSDVIFADYNKIDTIIEQIKNEASEKSLLGLSNKVRRKFDFTSHIQKHITLYNNFFQ